ncbi:DUF1643 domain-containing protein [Anabaena azotica]|uniref:DUF1643 domain-containing protein n=1 Tax=Anabaena azotica FACHB-119 TaxID=947527 RepID=A0ABR8CYE0_9NOST|nr:DUF1643 domain-containing protein [Anabaena azotica]MBD2499960.1 DUF1643 domain-containing protein [Anabaena azotica FACHB-119]
MERRKYIYIESDAKFDDNNKRKYRYLLRRKWNVDLPQVTFVMLNPSKANEKDEDPTLRRCIGYADYWGYGSLEVVNLFAYIATNPRDLRQADDPVGSENNSYIQLAAKRASRIILAWGANEYLEKNREREKEVISLIYGQQPLYCLKLTKYGYPHHPLRLSKDIQPIIFPNYF